eukprot:10601214-Ditylum_brightwellii.AAC.1
MKYPACKARVQVQGQAITRNCDKELRHAYTLSDFCKKMEDKFKWRQSIWAIIDCSPHGILLTRQTTFQQKLLVKVIHEWLPVLGAPYNPLPTTQCPCCNTELETFRHFVHCKHNIEGWASLILQLLHVYKKHNIDPVLQIIINTALQEIPKLSSLKKYTLVLTFDHIKTPRTTKNYRIDSNKGRPMVYPVEVTTCMIQPLYRAKQLDHCSTTTHPLNATSKVKVSQFTTPPR